MERETIEKIFNFLEEKEGKEVPNKWFESIKLFNLIQKLENHPDRTQYKHRGHLDLNRSTIKKLPNKLHVVGRLTLSNCKQLTKLPNDLYVGRNLLIYNTPLDDKYTNEEIKEIVASTGGQIIGDILRI